MEPTPETFLKSEEFSFKMVKSSKTQCLTFQEFQPNTILSLTICAMPLRMLWEIITISRRRVVLNKWEKLWTMVWSSLCPSGMTMLPTCSGSIPLIQLIRPPSVDQEEIALSPQENHLMLKLNIQMPELNSLTSKSVTSTPPSTHLQVQAQPQDAQEEALILASPSAHPPQLPLSKLALESALLDAHHQLNLSS